MTVTCAVNEKLVAHIGAIRARWWIINDLRYNVSGPEITFDVGTGWGRQFRPSYYHFDIQYRVLVEGGVEVRYKPFDMTIDLRWLAILYPMLIALFGVVLLSRKLRTHPHSESPKKKVVKL